MENWKDEQKAGGEGEGGGDEEGRVGGRQVGSKEGKETRFTAVLYTAQHSDSAAGHVAGRSR